MTVQFNIVDVNNLLHIGNHTFGSYSVKDFAGNNIKTGGMFMVLNMLRKKIFHPTNQIWIFCFDRKSFRKELSASLGMSYKSSRSKMDHQLYMQAQELEKWLDACGYNVMAYDGLEADDCITSVVRAVKPLGAKINILSTDRDLAQNISEGVILHSSNSKVASVSIHNYENVVGKKGEKVFYNSVLFYKVICGDSSDEVKPVVKESYYLYRQLMQRLINSGFDITKLNEEETMEEIIGYLPEQIKEKAENNWRLIKPFIIPMEQMNIKPQKINYDELQKFCSIFGMKAVAKTFNLTLTEPNDPTIKSYRRNLYDNMMLKADNTDSEEVFNDSSKVEVSVTERVEHLKEIDKILLPRQSSENTRISEDRDVLD